MKISRGDIFYVYRGSAVGSEQHSGRPAVVVSNDQNNASSSTIEVVFCTTQKKPELPTHTVLRSTPHESTVLCEQINTVSVERIGSYLSKCTEAEMEAIDRCLLISIGVDKKKLNEGKNLDHQSDEEKIKILIERDMYKKMYKVVLGELTQLRIEKDKSEKSSFI